MKKSAYQEATISQAIHTKWAGKTVHFVKKTDSTNLWAKKLAADGAEHGTLAVTEFQTAGRGRFERKWTAQEGSSIMMTLILRPDFLPQYASMLTLVMGLSVAQAVTKAGLKANIKWPNDVVVSGKKICGILTEMRADMNGIQYVVIGVGLNVNQERFPKEVQDKATSLYIETGKIFDRNQILAGVMETFEANYETFLQTLDFQNLKQPYDQILANRDRPVRVLDSEHSFEGIARGINQKGELLVQRENGKVETVGAGEVSVRGLYSYV